MNRDEFMAQLARLLTEMPETERMEAIRYYNDYFDEAGEENESKVIQELGSPGRVAASIKANLQENVSAEQKAENETADGYTAREYASQETNQNNQGAGNTSQEYTYGGSEQSEYTEKGYRENWNNSSNWNDAQAANMAVQKQRNTGKWTLLIILLVFASPVILGVGGGLLGGILGLLGGLLGVVAACLASSIGLICGGAAILIKGIINVVKVPAMGFTGMGGGLLAISLGLLLMVLFLWFCFQIIPRLFRTIVNFVSRILHKGKGVRQNEKDK